MIPEAQLKKITQLLAPFMQPQPAPPSIPQVNYEMLEAIGVELLSAIGADPDDPDYAQTPRRFAEFWKQFIEFDPGEVEPVYDTTTSGQMVIAKNVRVWGVRSDNLLPFGCDVSVGYIAGNYTFSGDDLSLLIRAVSHRLQTQATLAVQIADNIQRATQVNDVAVICNGVAPAAMQCTVMRGAFLDSLEVKSEFFSLING